MFMVKSVPSIVVCLTAASAYLAAPAFAEPITMATLEWPPYTGSFLPGEGATAQILRAAFASSETDVSLEFMPWNRAVAVARDSKAVLGYFPGYGCDQTEGFIASDPLGHGPLGFAQPRKGPLEWSTLEDLADKPLKFGTVRGYSNTEGFDALAADGRITVLTSKDDLANLRGLVDGRVDAAVIDRRVMRYLVRTEPTLWAQQVRIGFHTQLLAEVPLFACFPDNPQGRSLREQFNAGLAALGDTDQLLDAYLKREFE